MPIGASIGAAGIGALGSISGSLIQANSTKQASDVQQKMYQQTRSDLAPFREAGVTGTNMLTSRLPSLTAPINFDQATLENLPGYQFTLNQGLKSTQNSAAARGLGTSGAALKGASNYATGLANTTFGDAFNRELAQRDAAYNKLMGVSSLGSNAAAQTGNFATQTGQSIGQNTIAGGTAIAAGLNGAGNSVSNALNNIGGYQYANQLLGQGYVPNGFYRG